MTDGVQITVVPATAERWADFEKLMGEHGGYPIEPTKSAYPVAYAWTGFANAFRKAGFEEKVRRSETRPIMRRAL